jgi:hypothetical protein
MKWLEQSQSGVAAKVHTKMELLAKALTENRFQWDPNLDPATADPLARRLSDVSLFLRQVVKDIELSRGSAGGPARGKAEIMAGTPTLSSVPGKAISDLLRGAVSRFTTAGKTHAQWRQGYAQAIGEPAHKCQQPPGYEMRMGWSTHWIDRLDGPLIVMAGPSAPRGWSGWDVFNNLALEVWELLSEPLKGEPFSEARATSEWLAAVYGRLADTPFVKAEQRRDSEGALWELRELTVDPFTASAKAIELLLADWGVSVEWWPEPEAGGAMGQHEPKPADDAQATPKAKRSTERGEARVKLIAGLTKHHKYADGGCLNLEPIGNNELANLTGVSRSTASEFFNKEFNGGKKEGFAKYRVICRDAGRLADSLKALNGEFSPHELYGRRPPGEDERDDEE